MYLVDNRLFCALKTKKRGRYKTEFVVIVDCIFKQHETFGSFPTAAKH